jgi:hypothetical protein
MVSIMGVASQEMPACAQSCINFYTGCDTGDVACDCTVEHLTAMQNATFGTCIVDGCGPDVALGK